MAVKRSNRGTLNKAGLAKNTSETYNNVNESTKTPIKFENEVNGSPAKSNCSQEDQESINYACKSSDSDIEQTSAFNKQFYKAPKRRGSCSKPDPSNLEPMWRYYPKQVQSILKKKRIDRERLRRSLKPPGKRNYKHLFNNLQRVCSDEVTKASEMFKDIKDVNYKLKHAERKVRKALSEKGLFLDQHDFDIMAIFNQELSDSYFEEESENEKQQELKTEKRFEKIYVEEFDSRSDKGKLQAEKRQKLEMEKYSFRSSPVSSEQILNMYCHKCKPSVNIVKCSPFSNGFEYKSHISRATYKSHVSFNSKNSRRVLFDEVHPEKTRFEYNPFAGMEQLVRLQPVLDSSDSHSMLEGSDLIRSISMPIPHPAEADNNIIQPCTLERQPFSSMMNYSHIHQNNYINPLEKIDIKPLDALVHAQNTPYRVSKISNEKEHMISLGNTPQDARYGYECTKNDGKYYHPYAVPRFNDHNFEEI
jgi:hypothetical protein